MSDERRSHQATSLRTFFDEQLQHLQDLLGNLSSHIHDDEQNAAKDRQIVENFVDASNNKMRAVHDYAHRLRGHVRALYDHVLEIAVQIPPPVDLNPDAFGSDPLVNALFASRKDIDKLFEDAELEGYFRVHSKYQVPVLYALLSASKLEKHTLGISMQGDMVIHDVPQETVNFSGYKIHTPCASREELSTALEGYLFGRIVALIKQEMTMRKTRQLLNSKDTSYEARVNSLSNPDVYLDALVEYLEIPAKLLSIDKIHFKLSKLGIKLDDDDQQSANEFEIHELIWSDNSRNVMLQIAHAR